MGREVIEERRNCVSTFRRRPAPCVWATVRDAWKVANGSHRRLLPNLCCEPSFVADYETCSFVCSWFCFWFKFKDGKEVLCVGRNKFVSQMMTTMSVAPATDSTGTNEGTENNFNDTITTTDSTTLLFVLDCFLLAHDRCSACERPIRAKRSLWQGLSRR